MIIEIVGIDGSGKSTLTSWIAHMWGFTPRKVQPYDQSFWADAEHIEGSLGVRAVEIVKAGAIARALFLEMSRLDTNRIVFDRFLEGARMYWAVKELYPVPEECLNELPAADHVLFLDVDPEIAISRRSHASERTYNEEIAYLQKCAMHFRTRAVEKQWKVIDASLPLKMVNSEVGNFLTLIGV